MTLQCKPVSELQGNSTVLPALAPLASLLALLWASHKGDKHLLWSKIQNKSIIPKDVDLHPHAEARHVIRSLDNRTMVQLQFSVCVTFAFVCGLIFPLSTHKNKPVHLNNGILFPPNYIQRLECFSTEVRLDSKLQEELCAWKMFNVASFLREDP